MLISPRLPSGLSPVRLQRRLVPDVPEVAERIDEAALPVRAPRHPVNPHALDRPGRAGVPGTLHKAGVPGYVGLPSPEAIGPYFDDNTNVFPSGSLKPAAVPQDSVFGSWPAASARRAREHHRSARVHGAAAVGPALTKLHCFARSRQEAASPRRFSFHNPYPQAPA